MRELTENETREVSGGNPFFGGVQIAGAYYAGQQFGMGINAFNTKHFGMSLGQALYRAVHNE